MTSSGAVRHVLLSLPNWFVAKNRVNVGQDGGRQLWHKLQQHSSTNAVTRAASQLLQQFIQIGSVTLVT